MKKRIFHTVLFGLSIGLLAAQPSQLDSLKAEFSSEGNSPELCLDIANEYLRIHHLRGGMQDSVQYYLGQMSQDENELPDSLLAHKMIVQAELLKSAEDYSRSNQVLKRARQKFTDLGDDYYVCKTDYIQALNYAKIGMYKEALPLFEGIIVHPAVRSDSAFLAAAYSSYAGVLINLKQLDESRRMVLKAISLVSNKDSIRTGGLLYNLGLTYLNSEQLDSAYFYFQEALNYWIPQDYHHGIGLAYGSISKVSSEEKNYDRAIDYLLKSKKQFDKNAFNPILYELHLQIAENYLHLQNVKRAEQYMNYVDSLPLERRSLKLERRLDYLKAIKYEQLGDYKNAYLYHKSFLQKNDSLIQKEAQEKAELANKRLKFVEQSGLNEIEELSVTASIAKQQAEKRLYQTVLFAFVALVMLGVSVFLWVLNRRKRAELLLTKQLSESQMKNEVLKQKIDSGQRKLSSHTLRELEKNSKLEEIASGLEELMNESADEGVKKKLKNTIGRVNKLRQSEQHWEEFKTYFEGVHSGFLKTLQEKHPNLTQRELRLAAFSRLNLTTKEIASLVNSSPKSVEVARYRLRKKLHLESNTDLAKYFGSIA